MSTVVHSGLWEHKNTGNFFLLIFKRISKILTSGFYQIIFEDLLQ